VREDEIVMRSTAWRGQEEKPGNNSEELPYVLPVRFCFALLPSGLTYGSRRTRARAYPDHFNADITPECGVVVVPIGLNPVRVLETLSLRLMVERPM
jgi:hypothetical protein